MDLRMKRSLYIAVCVVAIVCSVASLEQLFVVGPTRWTMAFNVLSLVLILLAFKTRPVRSS